ncbi:MAG: hypothetical protein V4515_12230 [Chloroflexota bacterium]
MITADTVLAARDDAQPTGEAYCELAMTGAIVAGIPPLWRREVASFLRGILRRGPIGASPAYEPHRAILGALVLELETFAIRDAGEQYEPDVADLRDPAIVAREREAIRGFREWAAHEASRQADAYHAHVDSIVVPGDERHVAAMAALDSPPVLPTEAPAEDDWL